MFSKVVLVALSLFSISTSFAQPRPQGDGNYPPVTRGSVMLAPGETRNINGMNVSCQAYASINQCQRLARLDNDSLRMLLVRGLGACRAQSFEYSGPSGSGYACKLVDNRSATVFQNFDDNGCNTLIHKVKLMMENGTYEALCGSCQ